MPHGFTEVNGMILSMEATNGDYGYDGHKLRRRNENDATVRGTERDADS